MKLKIAACCLALAGMAVAQAAVAGSPGWAGNVLIREVKPREYGIDLWIPGSSNPMGCANGEWARLPINAANYDIIANVILDNARNHRAINFWMNGCDGDGAMLVIAADTNVW